MVLGTLKKYNRNWTSHRISRNIVCNDYEISGKKKQFESSINKLRIFLKDVGFSQIIYCVYISLYILYICKYPNCSKSYLYILCYTDEN